MSGGLLAAMGSALSGIDAFQQGAATVSENISNQATPGYAVRSLALETTQYGSGQAGSGVADPAAVTRAADQFAAARVGAATSANAGAGALATALSSIDQALQGTGDVHAAASQFFADLSTLASAPTSTAQRQTALADAQGVAASFNAASSALATQQDGIVQGLGASVTQANQLLGQLATINNGLQANPGSNSLLDQQASALQSLSGLIGVSTVAQPNGTIEVTAGGAVLLDASGAQTVSVQQSSPGAAPVVTAGTAAIPLRLSAASGAVGGALAAYQAAGNTAKSLDFYAGYFAASVNQAQAQGLDANGQAGQPLFSVPSPSVQAASTNTGTASLSATVTNAAALPSNGQGLVLTYGGAAGWTATVPQTNQTYNLGAGPNLAVAGLAVSVGGAPAKGDSFVVNPAPSASASIQVLTNQASAIAAADPYAATAGTISAAGAVTNNNAGTATESGDTVTATPSAGAAIVPGSYFGQSLTLTFSSPSSYSIQNASGTTITSGSWAASGGTNVAIGYPSGSPAAGQYWQVNLTGAPAAGDVVTLAPGGPNSGSNASRMASSWTSPSSAPGGSLQGAILAVVSQAGSASSAAKTTASSTATTLTSATNNLQTIAGVNPDQQAVLLTQYQQAYQAAAQVISTAHQMFESLVQAV
jgi:flagellar hook-associated protein 1 FlgK